jgi:restriction system protein
MEKCNKCGASIENGKCSYCGALFIQPEVSAQPQNVPPKQQYTQTNNVFINLDQAYPSTNNAVTESPKSKGIALLLVFFFGPLGLHHFYVGKVGLGILYLLTFGLFLIGWVFDFITIALGNYKDKNGLVLK